MMDISRRLLVLASSVLLASAANATVSVSFDSYGECFMTDGVVPGSAAIATLVDTMDTTGWFSLEVTTAEMNEGFTAQQLALAAGCAEGYLTHTQMYQYWYNYKAAEYGPLGPSTDLTTFMEKQEAWIREEVQTNPNDPFWNAMGLLMTQFDGLVKGYQYGMFCNESMSPLEMYMLNSVGDLEDLNGLFPAVTSNGQPMVGATADARASIANQVRAASVKTHTRLSYPPMPEKDKLLDCSALIRILPDGSDILAGHTTWRMYYAMLRIYKIYTFSYLPQRTISFSSSPGLLHSKDDFYITPQFVSMETTNSVFNASLYDAITPASAFSWQRVTVANGWAKSGAEWVNFLATANSGTYNNQWMVLDSSLFSPRMNPLPSSNLLWIAEQIPGYVGTQDVTSVLVSQGFWSSYNIPYLPYVYNISGYPEMVEKYGPSYSYTQTPRAKIFARNATMVEDMTSMQALLRYNNFQHDPLAGDDPILGSISSRADLRDPNPVAFGGVDSKVVAACQSLPQCGSASPSGSKVRSQQGDMLVYAQNGPTHDQQVPFDWSNYPEFVNVTHIGVPEAFDFPWTTFAPTPGF